VTIGNLDAFNQAEMQQLADTQCQKHGRYARFNSQGMGQTNIYDCVD
jgi:hypothetical protein